VWVWRVGPAFSFALRWFRVQVRAVSSFLPLTRKGVNPYKKPLGGHAQKPPFSVVGTLKNQQLKLFNRRPLNNQKTKKNKKKPPEGSSPEEGFLLFEMTNFFKINQFQTILNHKKISIYLLVFQNIH